MALTLDLTDNSQQVISALGSQKSLALEDVGFTAEGRVKELTPVDTSRLVSSIGHLVDDNSVTIGTNVEYAKYVEFDDKARHKKPWQAHFLRDGITKHINEYKEIIKQYLTR